MHESCNSGEAKLCWTYLVTCDDNDNEEQRQMHIIFA